MDEHSMVGVRELRQNLSKYLQRVQRGETFQVTEYGQPVAELAPIPVDRSPLARLIADGKATRPRHGLLDLLPPMGRPSTELSQALAAERSERLR